MKLIIDIPEMAYKNAKNNLLLGGDLPLLNKIIGNGIPYEERPQGECIKLVNTSQYLVKDLVKEKYEVPTLGGGTLSVR